jgi:hypothetical protein
MNRNVEEKMLKHFLFNSNEWAGGKIKNVMTLFSWLNFPTFSPLSLHHITLNTPKDISSKY